MNFDEALDVLAHSRLRTEAPQAVGDCATEVKDSNVAVSVSTTRRLTKVRGNPPVPASAVILRVIQQLPNQFLQELMPFSGEAFTVF